MQQAEVHLLLVYVQVYAHAKLGTAGDLISARNLVASAAGTYAPAARLPFCKPVNTSKAPKCHPVAKCIHAPPVGWRLPTAHSVEVRTAPHVAERGMQLGRPAGIAK